MAQQIAVHAKQARPCFGNLPSALLRILQKCPAPHPPACLAACRDMGTVVMGKSEAGVVKKGDTLMMMPNK